MTLMEAIAREEGFYVARTLPNRRNNPGDIVEGTFAQAHGALPTDGSRFAHFPSADVGFNAMRSLLNAHYLGLTVSEALNKWAPPVENQTNSYIANVCKWTGLTPDTIVTKEIIG
jgi:hypothetical protein